MTVKYFTANILCRISR